MNPLSASHPALRAAATLVGAVALISLAGPAAPAQSGEYRQSVNVVAWSEDGKSVLLWEEKTFENGGGELAYRLINGKKKQQRVVVSSIPDPAKGAKAEKIKARKCASGLKKLVRKLGKIGMAHVTGTPDCASARRDLLSVDPAHSKIVEAAWLPGDGTSLARGDIHLVKRGTRLELSKGNAAPSQSWEHHHEYLRLTAALSTNSHLLLVRHHWRDNAALAGVYYSDSGALEDYKVLKVR